MKMKSIKVLTISALLAGLATASSFAASNDTHEVNLLGVHSPSQHMTAQQMEERQKAFKADQKEDKKMFENRQTEEKKAFELCQEKNRNRFDERQDRKRDHFMNRPNRDQGQGMRRGEHNSPMMNNGEHKEHHDGPMRDEHRRNMDVDNN